LSPTSFVAFVTAAVIGFMLAELRVSLRNERLLRAAGAIEPPGDVYRAMAVLYPASFVLMAVEGAWRAAAVPDLAGGPSWAASGVVLFAASKALKYWAIRSLGERWSFRVLVQPGRPLVRAGPYAFVAHPNYIAVIGELAATAMMVGAPVTGPIMLLAFGAVLWRRIQFESGVLRGTEPFSTDPTKKGTEHVGISATSEDRKA
jgi:methyltransferase